MIDEEATFEKFGYYLTDLSQQSGKKIVVLCDDCGTVRIVKKSDYRSLCVSCTQKGAKNWHWQGGKVMRICEICGTEFPIQPLEIKKGKGRFCSPKCKGKWMSKNIRGKNVSNWNGGKITRICKQCGIEFPVKPSAIKRGRGKFCSPKCYGKWLSTHNKGKNNPSWLGGISFEPYCSKWNEPFREYIRDKFGRVCFLCEKTEEENGRKLDVHHINGNKACGCDGDKTCQFVPLCRKCHGKMDSKKIDWEAKIKAMMQNKLNGWYI